MNTIIGGCIAATVGFGVAWVNRRRDGRGRFLAVIGEIEAELDGCEHIDDTTKKVHASSLAPLRTAVFAVQPFVTECSFKRLIDLWHEYKNAKADALTVMQRKTAHDLKEGDPQTSPAYADDMLRSYCKKFRQAVGWFV